MRVAVITLVSGRHRHLIRQQQGLAASTTPADRYVVVEMNDPAIADWRPSGGPFALVERVAVDGTALPLAAARNAGARRAIRESADLLVFLDVDCIPTPDLIGSYVAAAVRYPNALLTGAVGYLPPDPAGVSIAPSVEAESVRSSANFHEFRPRLPAGEIAAADPLLFWSLNFAVSVPTWRQIGGFCEEYSGYGGEDTDFGLLARLSGTEMLWVGGAEAFHQHHASSDPPIEHLEDILRNGELFRNRWGFWPMEGWLRDFERLGLVRRDAAGDWARVRVTS